MIARGEFAPLREWLREKVHAQGSLHASPDELLIAATGEPLNTKYFLEHLRGKYSELYQLDPSELVAENERTATSHFAE